MNCREVTKLLSLYHDGELAAKAHDAIAQHLKICSSCAAALAGFEQLSDLSRQLGHPEPPDQWNSIEAQLAAAPTLIQITEDGTEAIHTDKWQRGWSKVFPFRLSLAVAALLIAVGIGSYLNWHSNANRHEEQLTQTFDAYLRQFEREPQAAEQVLLTSYAGRAIDLQAATKLLGYEPVVARGVPAGYTVDAVYLLNMPCCKCSQILCRRQDRQLAIFEHELDQPCWFGGRRAIGAKCCDKPTRIVELENNRLAATWKHGNRYVTVIGALDVEEVTQLVSYFEGRDPSS